MKAENEARTAAAKNEADRLKADNDARIAAAAAESDRLKRDNDSAAKQNAKLEAEKVELRVLLLKQFNAILQTRDTARGLIVNMSDVLFDTRNSRSVPRRARSWPRSRASSPATPASSWMSKAIPTASEPTITISSYPSTAARPSATT